MAKLLWHTEIRLPNGFVAPTHKVELDWSRSHAREACKDDRYGEIRQFKTLNLARFQVIEVETDNGKVVKILFRGKYDDRYDVLLPLIPNENGAWEVKTAWLNSKYDLHRTLDRSRYVQ